jgi:hypothetical protein
MSFYFCQIFQDWRGGVYEAHPAAPLALARPISQPTQTNIGEAAGEMESPASRTAQ